VLSIANKSSTGVLAQEGVDASFRKPIDDKNSAWRAVEADVEDRQ